MSRVGSGPNAELIGRAGSRAELVTPALVLDLDRLEANIEAMASHARRHGYMLRPSAKVHKCTQIAQLQIAAGSTVGVCCATLAEAEAMAGAGIPGVMLFASVVGGRKAERVAALSTRSERLIVAVDDARAARELAAAAHAHGTDIHLVVDYEIGGRRTGVADEDGAIALARLIAGLEGAVFEGVQGYIGRVQTIVDFEERRAVALRHGAQLVALVQRLTREGLAPAVVSTGGTGTHAIDCELGIGVEVQAGSYIFMDRHYADVIMRPAEPHPFAHALFVHTTVISASQSGFVITDAGVKEIDGYLGPRAPRIARGAPAGATYALVGDDLGRVELAAGTESPPLGAVLEVIPPHCWQTVPMYPAYHCVRGDTLVDIWPVDARDNW